MGAFAVVFILISGYLFVSFSTYQRYITRREDGHRYYFRCGAFGICFSIIGLVLALILDGFDLPSWLLRQLGTSIEQLTSVTKFAESLQDYLSFKFLLGTGLAVIIGPISAILDNFWRNEEKSRASVHQTKSPAIERFLFECGSTLQTVLITLKSRKVYVGLIHDISIESGEVEHFTILPMLSGYRDKDTLALNFNTNYYLHYEKHLDEDGEPIDGNGASLYDFIEMIPVSEISHLGSFDIDSYKKFLNETKTCLDWMQPTTPPNDDESLTTFIPPEVDPNYDLGEGIPAKK